jgi:hypothetical protein
LSSAAAFRPQGRQRARRGAADPGADREGPGGPRFVLERGSSISASASSSGRRDVAETKAICAGRAW